MEYLYIKNKDNKWCYIFYVLLLDIVKKYCNNNKCVLC